MRPHYAALTHAGKYSPVLRRCVILASIRRAIVAGAGMLGGTPTRQVQKVWGWLRPCRRDKSTIAASPRQRQFAAHGLQISCCSRKPLDAARPFLGTGRRHQFTIGKPNAPHPARTHWPLEATKGYGLGTGTVPAHLAVHFSDCRGFGHGGLDGHPGLRPRHIGSNGTLGAGIRRNVLRHFSPSDRRFPLIRRLHGFLATITPWCGFRRGDAPAHDREAPRIDRYPHQKRVHCQVPHISRATIA